jgi:hypothetical protein
VTYRNAVALLCLAVLARPAFAADEKWPPAVLADGQPDVRGYYRAERSGTYSLRMGTIWGAGVNEMVQRRDLQAEGQPLPSWPSRIVDPPDGDLPYQPWARARQQELQAHMESPTRQRHLDPQARCFPNGPIRGFFLDAVQFHQFPGYVVITSEQNHLYRVIPLDGRPHPPEGVKLWMGDSRGHWEGTTLVVDVTNLNGKARLDQVGNFVSDEVHLLQRFIFSDANTFELRVSVDDPTVYTRPWTISAKFNRQYGDQPGYETWEQECQEHEMNASSLSRDIEAAERKKRR